MAKRLGLNQVKFVEMPFSGLVAEVLNIVRELADEGMTMLLATHEMAFAREASSRVCFLDQGVVREQGPPDQIFSEPADPRTQAFLKRIIEAGRL